ncbi:unnamed protein product [Sphagnum tenellum]
MANCKTKILLFGRTGSGKSTVANMLIKGNLESPLLFETSSGIRGKTISFQREENDEYMVVDTVGFGEVERGTVSDVEARNRLYDFFTKINETGYNYFAFVRKWGKIDELDTRLWNFFKKAFEGVERNFVLLFTQCKHSTLQENMEEVKATFEGCSKFIAVDFPPRSKQKGSNPVRVRQDEKMRARSLEHLQDELKKSMWPSSTPSLHSTMSKGRLLLLGRCASARNMIAKLLVNGTLDHNSISGKEESQQGEASTSSSTCSGVPVDETTPYEELEGRGWQVVNVTAFESLVKAKVSPYLPRSFAEQFGDRRWIPWQTEQAMLHGSYSHIIYIEEIGYVSEAEKLVHSVITRMLRATREYLVAIIVENNAQSTLMWNIRENEDLEYTSETRDTDGQLYMRFSTDLTRSNEDVRNYIILDNIRKDDTLILWLCPPPLESQFSFAWSGAQMRVEA